MGRYKIANIFEMASRSEISDLGGSLGSFVWIVSGNIQKKVGQKKIKTVGGVTF